MSISDSVLLVEGENDKHVVSHICERDGRVSDFEIKNMAGIDNVLKVLPVEVKSGKQKVIGILADTDDDAEYCWYIPQRKRLKKQICKERRNCRKGSILRVPSYTRIIRLAFRVLTYG